MSPELLEIYNIKSLGKLWYSKLKSIKVIDELHIKNIIEDSKAELYISGKNLFIPLRLILIGKEHGPDLYSIINLLGKKESLRRIKLNLNGK